MHRSSGFIIIISIAIFLMISCSNPQQMNHPTAEKGVIDLSGISLEETGEINLDGQWEFYWSELLTPSDFIGKIPESECEFIETPGSWTEIKDNPSNGYATLRLIINGLTPGQSYSLRKV